MSAAPRMNSEIQSEQEFVRIVLRETGCDNRLDAIDKIKELKKRVSQEIVNHIHVVKPGANSRQVGGSHYEAELQHWDVIETYGIGYIEGCSSKYVTRARKKNGRQDVEKTIHYIEKLLELKRPPRGFVPVEVCLKFVFANRLTDLEGAIIIRLLTWSQFEHLEEALQMTKRLLKSLDPVETAPGAGRPV